MAREPDITVIVPAHRAAATIGECVAALGAQTLDPDIFEVVVVDTGVDGTESLAAHAAEALGGRYRWVRAERMGPAAQRNQGARLARGRFLAFTDADCVPDVTWLAAGLNRLRGGAALVQGPTLVPEGRRRRAFDHCIEVTKQSGLYESCNIMYERSAFDRVGGFHGNVFERAGEHFGEDTLLAWEVIRGGGSAEFEPGATVRHAVVPIPFDRFLAYQAKSRHFPFLVAAIPELRSQILTAQLFLGGRSVRFDAAVAGLLVSRRSHLGLLLCLPYVLDLARHELPARRRLPFALKRLVSDAVRFASLVWGSIRHKSPVL